MAFAQVQQISVPIGYMREDVFEPAPIWQLVFGWVLLVPMLYIAGDGVFAPPTGGIGFAATGGTPGTSVAHKVGLVCFSLICTLLITFRWSRVVTLSRRAKTLLSFPLLAILSCAWSAEPSHSIVSGAVILVLTLFAIYVSSELSFQRQFELLIFVGAAVLPISIALAVLVPSVGADSTAWRGILVSKQNCSAVCTLLLITALHWTCRGVYQKCFRVTYILMCVLLIVMSQSRTGWLLALVAFFLTAAVWILQRMPRKQVLATVLLACSVTPIVSYGIYIYSRSILTFMGKDPTLSERTVIWAAVWQAILQHPILGYGFASFWSGLYGPSQNVTLVAGWGLAQAQDGFLDVWLGTGVIGVALIGAIALQAIRNAARCASSKSDEAFVRWSVVVILCVLIFNIGESSIGLFRSTWFLFLLACLGLNQAAAKQT
jgi:exopolysaccharide production protein ExoQ